MPQLILVGLDHRTASVGIRERLNVSDQKLPEAISSLRRLPTVDGAAILSTCNRVEAVVSARSEDVIESIVEWLSARADCVRDRLEGHLYILRDMEVVAHLFRVAAGIDSMIIGEPQIGGQVRNAFQAAIEAGSLDSLLQQLFEQTLRVARKIRSETGLGEHAVSASWAAVELAKKIFGDLHGLRILLIGVGEMAELTAQHLQDENVTQVFVANRSYRRAVELAQRFRGQAVHFDAIDDQLLLCDIVIASTGAPHYLIREHHVRRALEARRRRSLFFIDLAVPRNIEPAIARCEGAYLYNIDDLQSVARDNLLLRQRRAKDAERIVEREVQGFEKRLIAREAVPTIVDLRTHLEEIRASEVEKYLHGIGPINAEQRQAIEIMTLQMINKILHYPILQLKTAPASAEELASMHRAVRMIFGLR